MIEGETIFVFTIYDHPKEHPSGYMATRDLTLFNPPIRDNLWWIKASNVEFIRNQFRTMGLKLIPRKPDDDPTILETWQ